MRSTPARKIVLFMILTVIFVIWPYVMIARSGTLDTLPTLVLMWAPGLAALITQMVTAGTLRGLGWQPGRARYWLAGFLIPLLACLIVYGLVWSVGLVPFTGAGLVDAVAAASGRRLSLPLAVIATVVVGFLPTLFAALGEEIGWRGLLLPQLAARYRFTVAALVSGVIWAIYHYPAMLLADYHSAAPLWFALPMFTLSVVAVSFILAWLRLKSGSLWVAAILHASHNLFVQAVFDMLTLDFGLAPYLTTEFGAGLAIVYTVLAFLYWRRRAEVEQQPV